MSTWNGIGLTVGQLAITHPGAQSVFAKYNIDYCCGGSRSLEEECHRIGLDPEKILTEISDTASIDATRRERPENWSSQFLADYIVAHHHAYVKKAASELQAFLDKVCDRHGNDCLELLNIRECFLDVSEELALHMEKEEKVLFPLIKRLELPETGRGSLEIMIKGAITSMEDEHESAGDLIKEIRRFSNHYAPPDYACPTFRITYQKLKEFDEDLMQHIHLENNILFERFKRLSTDLSCCL